MMDAILEQLLQSDTNVHHVRSFNHLLSVDIPDIIMMYGRAHTIAKDGATYTLKITDVVSTPTRPTASNCHTFGLNYLFCVNGTVTLFTNDVEVRSVRMPIMHIPMMTGRTVLTNDRDPSPEPFSGLFISKGKCRTIPPSKNVLYNTPILSTKHNVHSLQVRSTHPTKVFRSTSTFDMSIDTMDTISCRLPFLSTAVHLRTLVVSLGCDPRTFYGYLRRMAMDRYDEGRFYALRVGLVDDHRDIHTPAEAVLFISKLFGKPTPSTGLNVLKNEVFPHVGPDFVHKVQYLASCVLRLFLFRKGMIQATPRDNYAMNQIITSADHLGSMVRLVFITHMRTCGKLLRRMMSKPDGTLDIAKVYGEHRISSRIMSAVASGAWSVIRKGVSISLNSNNFDAIEAQLRRISSSLAMTSGNHTLPRNVMTDQYGFVCAASSPDGDGTGLIYEMALTATLSPPVTQVPTFSLILYKLLAQWILPVETWIVGTGPGEVHFYVDATGRWAGCLPDADAFVEAFRTFRRQGDISPFAFIERHDDSRLVRITYQQGILCRPLVVADRLSRYRPGDTLNRLVARGIVEYVSPAEQSTICRIALTRETASAGDTHIELTQVSFLGKLASSIAFVTGQQGPRLAYSTLQRKQIITGGEKRFRGANDSNRLWTTHRPLVRTKTASLLPEALTVHRGVPVVLAMMALPQNQEDAIILKRGTLERGAFMMSDNQTYVSEASTTCPAQSDQFECPDDVISKKNVSYQCIEASGIPVVGTYVPGGSVVIGKTRAVKRTSICKSDVLTSTRRCDISTCTKKNDDGHVTEVEESTMPNGKRVRVVVSTTRMPTIGDKFTSQYAQKGVVGAVWDDVDMPVSMTSGIAPDLIVSPLSMTSRMTMSSLLETLCGKSVCAAGDMALGIDHQDYLAGNDANHRRFEQALRDNGFAADGTEEFIDGRTGAVIQARIFVGVVEYYRLVHIAAKKIHARSTGPRDPLTRQPRDGRRFGGGLRIGEMESSALAAHGSSRVLQERFRELSDAFEIYVCSTCHLICDETCRDVGYTFCRRCQSDTSVRSVLVPFTFLVLTLELLSTGIVTRFHVDGVNEYIGSD